MYAQNNPQPSIRNQDDQRRTRALNGALQLALTNRHTQFSPTLFLHPTPLSPLCLPSSPPPPASQHCAPDESASVCVKGRVVHGVAWDRLCAKATGLVDTLQKSRGRPRTHRHPHTHTHFISPIQKLTVQQAVPSSPGLLGPSLLHDDKHPPVL